MPVICPNCSHSFDPTPPPPERKKFKLPVSWRTILSLIVLVFFGSIVYQYVQEIDTKHLVSSVTTLQSNLQKAYEVFDQVSTIPLDHWYAKVTYVNFTLIRDLSPGDFQGFKNIAPGTYLEIKN